jgi:hypothetical protein
MAVTSSEALQQHLPDACVVKAINNISAWHLRSLARSRGVGDRSTLPHAGDDRPQKQPWRGSSTPSATGPLTSGGRTFLFSTPAWVAADGKVSDSSRYAGSTRGAWLNVTCGLARLVPPR